MMVVAAVVGLLAGGLLPGARASAGRGPAVREARPQPAAPEVDLSRSAARQLLGRGYLVPDPGGYDRAKRILSGRPASGAASHRPVAAASGPTTVRKWHGIFDPRATPPDATGAIGPGRYVQLVNTRFGIYRTDGHKLSSGDLGVFTGMGLNYPFLTDPQVIWDAGTRRFYYIVLDFDLAVIANPNRSNRIDFAFGFSKTSIPNNAGDWCKYALSLGYDDPDEGHFLVPDQPHLGDTSDFLLWGVNAFDVLEFPRYVGADVDWATKPPSGRSCPRRDVLETGRQRKLRAASGSLAFTPVVANQIDPARVGWVVAAEHLPTARSSASTLSLFRVSPSGHGTPEVQNRGSPVNVRRYSLPPPARQARGGPGNRLDTLDVRLTQAVSANDPSHGRVAVWTQHTAAGGGGSRVQWYQIDPAHHRLFQQGVVSDPDMFAFNAAISPDRVVRPGVRKFGRAMVLGYNTSSRTTDAAVRMVSKRGTAPQSDAVLVQRSPGPAIDGTCRQFRVCRWGDFPGASPDPSANVNEPRGRVWLTNMWNVDNTPHKIDWRTVIWKAAP
jgi:hypothetical protein